MNQRRLVVVVEDGEGGLLEFGEHFRGDN